MLEHAFSTFVREDAMFLDRFDAFWLSEPLQAGLLLVLVVALALGCHVWIAADGPEAAACSRKRLDPRRLMTLRLAGTERRPAALRRAATCNWERRRAA
jgi:hypothetical protein